VRVFRVPSASRRSRTRRARASHASRRCGVPARSSVARAMRPESWRERSLHARGPCCCPKLGTDKRRSGDLCTCPRRESNSRDQPTRIFPGYQTALRMPCPRASWWPVASFMGHLGRNLGRRRRLIGCYWRRNCRGNMALNRLNTVQEGLGCQGAHTLAASRTRMQKKRFDQQECGAGDGNRNRMTSLEVLSNRTLAELPIRTCRSKTWLYP
jgi:hypothetical protein